MKRGINIAILGRGTVAQGVIKLLKRNRRLIEKKVGATLSLAGVLSRGTRKQKDIQLPARLLTDVPDEILSNPDIDIIVELIGGYEPARSYILKAMEAGKGIVTANKGLLWGSCGET